MAHYIAVEHTSAPEVLTLTQAVKQLKMEDLQGFDDDIITECIEAAIDEAESYTNINIRERKFKVISASWLDQDFEFREQIIQSITKITHKPSDGSSDVVKETTTEINDFVELLPKDKYAAIIHYVDEENLPELIENKTDAVSFEITVGYAKGKVPKGLLQGIKLLMNENYNIRNNIESKSYQTVALRKLEPYKYYR